MKKLFTIAIAVLVLLTAVFAAVHLTTRDREIPGVITVNGESVDISGLELKRVTGTTENAKGEKKKIDADGIALMELLKQACSSVTVTASDSYSAKLGAEDMENAYIIVQDDGTARLIVFGRSDSKCDVKNVVKIESR